MCESKENNEIFFSHETYTKGFVIVFRESQIRHKFENYCNLFNNSELIRSLSCDFFLQEEIVFNINICVLIY